MKTISKRSFPRFQESVEKYSVRKQECEDGATVTLVSALTGRVLAEVTKVGKTYRTTVMDIKVLR